MESNELSSFESIDLLEAFIVRYNAEQDAALEQLEAKELASSIMAADKREIQALKDELAAKDEVIKKRNSLIAEYKAAMINADTLARKHESTKITINQYKVSNDKLRAELKAIKALGCAKKAKDQIKRVKAKSETYQARVKQLEKEAKIYIKENKDKQAEIDKATAMMHQNHVNDDQVGIYHNGDHNLIVWQQVLSPEYKGKKDHKQRALLHLNKGGTARLVFFDEDDDDIVIARPPARYNMPKDVREFATNWLRMVNVEQGGNILPKDFERFDLN